MKLTEIRQYKKDGTQIVNGYRVGLTMSEIKKHNLQDKELVAEYYDDKIILKVKETI